MRIPNPYSEKLAEFSDFAFHEPDVVAERKDWKSWFAARMGKMPAKLVYEIGCSNAEFLCSVAKKNPDFAFIGIDWKYKVLYKGAKKVQAQNLKNVALIRGRASETEKIFSESELGEIWIFFPDPWAKKSQMKNRFFQEKFLMPLSTRLCTGGEFHFKTDHPGYYSWCMASMGEKPNLPEFDYKEKQAQAHNAAVNSYTLKQAKVRNSEEELPEKSEKLIETFAMTKSSFDFWSDIETGKFPKTLYSQDKTLFESGFVRQGLPIFAILLKKK